MLIRGMLNLPKNLGIECCLVDMAKGRPLSSK